MKVENMAINQFIIYLDNCTAFQSYDSLIAVTKDKRIYVSDKWDCSRTTLKYFKKYVDHEEMSKKELSKVMDNYEKRKIAYFYCRTEKELMGMIKCQNES